jgi:protein-L-isoaspartate(D-aspartate) O-methyltransferase
MDMSTLNKKMVDGQIKPLNGINEKLLSIFYALDRKDFMPEKYKASAYIEKNILLEENRVILRPDLIAKIVINIDLKDNENVLLLGSSTGYLSAILSFLAETVIVVEEKEELLKISENAIKYSNINNVVYFKDKISNGCISQSPFNAIIIEGSVNELPSQIINQLDTAGRLLTIISENDRSYGKMFRKNGNILHEEWLFSCSLPILNSFKIKNHFSF